MSNPLLIGVTGGIGSGKSLVCKIFSLLGASVYYADDRAKWISNHDPIVREKIIREFGREAYSIEGLNREYLAQTVFSDNKKLEVLNAIVHPAVGNDFQDWVKEQHTPYILKEAALMFESGSYKMLDKVVTVTAPAEVRIRRVLQRDPHRTRIEVEGIIQKQLSEEERIRRADYVLYNDESKLVIPQVLALHEEFSR